MTVLGLSVPELVAWSWLFAASSVSLFAVIRRLAGREVATTYDGPPLRVSVVRPCAGSEPELDRALMSTTAFVRRLRERTPQSDVSVRIAIATHDDPAAPTASRLVRELRLEPTPISAELVVTDAMGPNYKADQLGHVLADVACDVVIVADSDVDLTSVNPDDLLAPLEESPHLAAVWCAPVEIAPKTFGDLASAGVLESSLHSFGLLGALDARGLVGKLTAIRARDLERVGGFSSLRYHLGEDMELARRLSDLGKPIVLSEAQAPSLAQGRSLASVLSRYSRWLHVIRAQRPLLLLSYPLLLAFFPVYAVFISLAAPESAALLIGVGIAVRVAIGVAARALSRRDLKGLLTAIVLSDLTLLWALSSALFATRIIWRGRVLEIARGGQLVEVLSTGRQSLDRGSSL